MKFLINELEKYVDIKSINNEKLIEIFTSLAFEVEDVYPAAQISGVKLAKTFNKIKHPNADSLSFLKTKIDNNEIDVICGAKNIESNMIVAHAIPGSKVGEMKMKPKELRGIISNGMILSISEIIGIPNDYIEDSERKNIFVFPKETDISKDPLEILELNGYVFDLSILPDRQYASNYFSMAREISAFTGKKFKFNINEVKREESIKANLKLGEKANSIFVTNATLNKNVKTPFWIKRILYHAGIKPQNSIEDISNYVLLMTGSPTYILDRKNDYKLSGGKLNDIDLFESNLLNSKNELISFVTIGTDIKKNIVNIKNINKISGARIAKGINQESAINSSKLILDIAYKTGYIKSCSKTISKINILNKSIDVEKEYIFNYLGKKIDLKNVQDKLNILGITNNLNTYKIPIYREDIKFKSDIVEEIVRIYGVENISPNSYKLTSDKILEEPHKKFLIKLSDELIKYGFFETKNYQLINELNSFKYNYWNIKKFVKLREDYHVEYNTLQTSLIYGLIESFKNNYKNDIKNIKLFEFSNIFHDENPVFSLGIIHDDFLYKKEPILATKEIVLRCFEKLNIDLNEIEFLNSDSNIFNPFVSSKIKYKNKIIGIIGEIHPSILRENKFIRLDKIKAKLYYAEIQLEKLI